MKLVEYLHSRFVQGRRAHVLAGHLARLIPQEANVLDVGCGDGAIAQLVARLRPDLRIVGIDVLPRDESAIPITLFDGQHIPFADGSFDAVLFIDVLHHTLDPLVLLGEASRVSRGSVLIKDHTLDGPWAQSTLEFMDRVHNERYGVALPFNYWPRRHWQSTLTELRWSTEVWIDRLGLYPWPISAVFERSLHFIARLAPQSVESPRRVASTAACAAVPQS